ncbi:MAG: Methionine transporter ATP-binding protein [Labilithrix sp.]|nr:Methionine transporter ATP-binding protein [Labilithrix sp.]
MEALLVARDITVVRDDRRVVDAATVTLDTAAIVTIQGGSGSGKSTLLRAIATLIPTSSGQVLFEGREPQVIGVIEYRRRVAYVPQLPQMFEGTVAENVRTGPGFRGVALSDTEVVALLEHVGLGPELAPRAATELSGGERLRVALARALANEPRVLLLDEPTSALDPVASRVVLDLLRALARRGTAILAVTHVEEHATYLEGQRFRMTNGALRADAAESAS